VGAAGDESASPWWAPAGTEAWSARVVVGRAPVHAARQGAG